MAENSSTNPGTNLADSISGTTAADSLTGGGGNDTISGGGGADYLAGDQPLTGQWAYSVYNYNYSSANGQAPNTTSGTLVGQGYVDDFGVGNLANISRGNALTSDPEDFGVILTSRLVIPTGGTGTYTFSTTSDDGSRIVIRNAAGNVVNWQSGQSYLNNDYHQSATTRSDTITLTAGQTYTIEVYFWENEGANTLSATIRGPATSNVTVDLATTSLLGTPPTTSGHVDGNDSISGGDGNDTILGNGGNDTLNGDAGADQIYGGTGNDLIYGGADNDTLYGDDGADRLYGGAGNDSLYGGAGSDSLYGDAGNDRLFGGDDADTFYLTGTSFGTDVITGGEGGTDQDVLDTTGVTTGTISVVYTGGEAGTLTSSAGGTATFSEIEVITTGAGNDTINAVSNTAPSTYNLGAGDDRVFGGSGAETINAGDGADSVEGGGGADHIYGGSGNDSLYGGEGDDLIDGGTGNDLIYGGTGSDTLYGGDGNDTIDGGTGNDLLSGGAGADTVYGGDGNDTIHLGEGVDHVYGGADQDTFIIDRPSNLANFGAGSVIDGGSTGSINLDTLDLSAWSFADTDITYTSADKKSGYVTFYDENGNSIGSITFSEIENIVITCFTPGSLAVTERGPVAVEDLQPGDRVLTRDQGFQEIVWTGARKVSAERLRQSPALRGVRIAADAFAPGCPARDMVVSPQHRVLFSDPRAELLFHEAEVLIPAIHLVGRPGITRAEAQDVTYIHFMCREHQIVLVDGCWSESYQPGEIALAGMPTAQRLELMALFPELIGQECARHYPAARATLRRKEAAILFAA